MDSYQLTPLGDQALVITLGALQSTRSSTGAYRP